MKRFAILCTTALLTIPPSALAQLNIQGDDGSTVQIGPGGINVQSNHGKHANVHVGPGGIRVNQTPAAGYKKKTTTSITGSGLNTRTTVTTATASTFNLKNALTKMEMSAYGKANESAPIIQRIQKLEMDNLGHTGTGSNIARVKSLAVAMGVSLGNSGSTTSGSTTNVATNVATTRTVVNTSNAQPAPAFWDVSSDHQNGVYYCNNSVVSITANHCNLVLTGHCKTLSISGNHNNVRVESASGIDAIGNHNTVMWVKTPMPQISNAGNYNNIGQVQ